MGGGGAEGGKKWTYATVCSSNMNRSMEAHFQMQARGFNVRSYGTVSFSLPLLFVYCAYNITRGTFSAGAGV
jgi:hypothetical protein